ncbi:MAG: hypothetical protein KDD51_09185 [Bdellovibrionales bacterium]|nr:hypothetical protein [Bdellovibrionales bacterium]
MNYPTAEIKDDVAKCCELLSAYGDTSFEGFDEYIKKNNPERLEEVYTATFDVNAVCHLDVGYVLFGEDYKRGEMLVHLSRAHNAVQNRWGTELPDHLPNVLNLLPLMQDRVEREDLVKKMVHPAVRKMIESFDKNPEKANAYRFALETVDRVFVQDFGEPEPFPEVENE